MGTLIFIYGIVPDNGIDTDLDAAIDAYYYRYSDNPYQIGYRGQRQYVVDMVKGGVEAYTYRNNHIGSRCVVKTSPNGIEYLKTMPNGDESDNISSLPVMQ